MSIRVGDRVEVPTGACESVEGVVIQRWDDGQKIAVLDEDWEIWHGFEFEAELIT